MRDYIRLKKSRKIGINCWDEIVNLIFCGILMLESVYKGMVNNLSFLPFL